MNLPNLSFLQTIILYSTLSKTLEYYKMILTYSQYVTFKLYIKELEDTNGNPIGKEISTHSCAQIFKVHRPSFERGINLSRPKSFTIPFNPPRYTYWDHKATQFHSFSFQNEINQHSYLFYFMKTNKYNFPAQFITWWTTHGSNLQILSPDVNQGYQLFEQTFEPPQTITFP